MCSWHTVCMLKNITGYSKKREGIIPVWWPYVKVLIHSRSRSAGQSIPRMGNPINMLSWVELKERWAFFLAYSLEFQFQLLLHVLFSQLNEKADDIDKTYNHLYSCFLFLFPAFFIQNNTNKIIFLLVVFSNLILSHVLYNMKNVKYIYTSYWNYKPIKTINTMIVPTCPWPSEMALNFSPLKPLSSANLSRAAIGSAPGDSTKMRGAHAWESR